MEPKNQKVFEEYKQHLREYRTELESCLNTETKIVSCMIIVGVLGTLAFILNHYLHIFTIH